MRLQLLSLLVFLSSLLFAQDLKFKTDIPYHFFKDEQYGDHQRNTFDLLQPVSHQPTALVIYIHGGGFLKGDKTDVYKYYQDDIRFFLENNIAFATVNYQFYHKNDSIGIGRCLGDVKKVLQFIRHYAKRFNIDKENIAVYGNSAGAGSALYLAFHDDMALKGDTSLLGESTRVKCVGALNTQATYDIPRWYGFIPGLRLTVLLKLKSYHLSMANFYGYADYKDFSRVKSKIGKLYDMLSMITPDDPPVYVYNPQKERFLKSYNIILHHRGHALELEKFLKKKNVVHQVYVYEKNSKQVNQPVVTVRDFIYQYLKGKD